MIRRVPTWFWEQVVLGLLALPGLILAITSSAGPRDVVKALLALAGLIVSQKIRSGNDRQREQDVLFGYSPARLACRTKIDRWTELGQVLAVVAAAAGATSLGTYTAAILPLAFTLGYPGWRRFFRKRWPARPDAPVAAPGRIRVFEPLITTGRAPANADDANGGA